MQLKASQFLGLANSPSSLRSASLVLPEGISINPDAADGQTACTDAQANFDSRGPGRLPRQLEDRQLRHRDAGARRPADRLALLRRAEAGQPVPGLHGRQRLRHQRQARRLVLPDPKTGQLTMTRRRPAAGAVRKVQPAPLRLRSRPRRHADPLRHLPGRLALRALERELAPQHSKPIISRQHGAERRPLPGRNPPLQPVASWPACRTRSAGAFSDFT